MDDQPFLHVDQVSKVYNDGVEHMHALDSVTFTVDAGEFVCLLGPSGSGKSTLLRIVGGLLPPSSGQIWFQGEPVSTPHPKMGIIFQNTNLLPWRTVLDNVLLPMEVQAGRVSASDRQHARELLELVGLGEFGNAYPQQLSGGMSQRAVFARTLLQQPELLLMDEPFGALDALTRERLNAELLRLQAIHTRAVLMVTHSISEAVFLADQVLILTNRPGRIHARVPIDLPKERTLEIMASEQFARLSMQIRRLIEHAEEAERAGAA